MEKIILCLQHSEIKLQDASACHHDGCLVFFCVEVNVISRLICYVDIQIQKRKMIKIQIKTVDALFCE